MPEFKLTEEDVKNRFITPALISKNWDKTQMHMEYAFTAGRVSVWGNTAKRDTQTIKKADYLLTARKTEMKIALIEAKDGQHSVSSGIQQALHYAELLDVPFVYSSNGTGFLEHDRLTGHIREIALNEFPTEDELWERYKTAKGFTPEQIQIIEEPYYFDAFSKKKPRYYQRIAIDRTIEAIARGEQRILLVMATGTGKTFTAFQIIWRLIKSGTKKRILYLADRNVLIDQTMQKDFKPFEGIMTKVKGNNPNDSYEVYMSLYQQLAGEDNEEPFRAYAANFFDLIVVDECHRGSAEEDSQWRRILEYFSSATQIGMTATPKETKYVSNINYFGEPVYIYSLKQGIDDGFLAPYKVIRVDIDKDVEGYIPSPGKLDVYGNEIEEREYNRSDFDRTLIIDNRTRLVAQRVTQWLKQNGRFKKTIIFCVDIDHAERMCLAMRQENEDLVKENYKYVMQITGDNEEGKKQLDYFIDPNEEYPTIATTSKLLTTGVDCVTCELIVLDSNINSMTEFKQIIGRGTRLYPKKNKYFFTIMDFRGVCRLFWEKEFDGEPVIDTDFPNDQTTQDTRTEENSSEGVHVTEPLQPPPTPSIKYRVNDVEVEIVNEMVQYINPLDGKLIVESLTDFTKRNMLKEYATLDDFIRTWHQADKKKAIVDELREKGIFWEVLKKESEMETLDDFDLICHIAYDKRPLTKRERVEQVKKCDFLSKYSGVCREVLSALLDKYMDEGIGELEDTRILENAPFNHLGSPQKIARFFGGKKEYVRAVRELENQIYAA